MGGNPSHNVVVDDKSCESHFFFSVTFDFNNRLCVLSLFLKSMYKTTHYYVSVHQYKPFFNMYCTFWIIWLNNNYIWYDNYANTFWWMIFKDIYCIIILDFGNWLVCRLISIVKTAAEGNICSHLQSQWPHWHHHSIQVFLSHRRILLHVWKQQKH